MAVCTAPAVQHTLQMVAPTYMLYRKNCAFASHWSPTGCAKRGGRETIWALKSRAALPQCSLASLVAFVSLKPSCRLLATASSSPRLMSFIVPILAVRGSCMRCCPFSKCGSASLTAWIFQYLLIVTCTPVCHPLLKSQSSKCTRAFPEMPASTVYSSSKLAMIMFSDLPKHVQMISELEASTSANTGYSMVPCHCAN